MIVVLAELEGCDSMPALESTLDSELAGEFGVGVGGTSISENFGEGAHLRPKCSF